MFSVKRLRATSGSSCVPFSGLSRPRNPHGSQPGLVAGVVQPRMRGLSSASPRPLRITTVRSAGLPALISRRRVSALTAIATLATREAARSTTR